MTKPPKGVAPSAGETVLLKLYNVVVVPVEVVLNTVP
jgi:hypothetical protein